MQGIYLGYMHSRWRKIRGLEKDDPVKNSGEFKVINKKEFFDLFSLCNGNNSFAEIVEIFKEDDYTKDELLELIFKLEELKIVEFWKNIY